jgi:tRNA(fMet)-specific endonuclease VapC
LEKLEKFLAPFEVMPFDDAVASVYARVRGEAETLGRVIGPNDLLIAATVIFHHRFPRKPSTASLECI